MTGVDIIRRDRQTMPVSELDGAQLDHWVAKALSWKFDGIYLLRECEGVVLVQPAITCDDNGEVFMPSIEWAHGGPIIEREREAIVNYLLFVQGENLTWVRTATLADWMRAFVASKFGETVHVP